MSKSNDSMKSYTANNYYKYALEGFNNTNILKEQQGLTPLAIAGYNSARGQLTKALLFGKIDACAGLALFNQQGIGGPVSPYNQKLFLVIGSKFGNQACKQTLAQLQNNNYDVEREANIWVNHINTYKRDLDKEITTTELAASSAFLENALKQHNVSLEAYNAHILITKTVEEIVAEGYTPPPPPKPPVNYYEPSYKNTATTTSYTYPEQPKYNVKSMGETQEKHHTCEIL